MKKYILLIALFIASIGNSQVVISNGEVSEGGEIQPITSSTSLPENFTWKILEDSTINCFVQNGEKLMDILVWRIHGVMDRGDVTTYFVKSDDGSEFYLDFLEEGKSVIIFDILDKSYSLMEGEGVYYNHLN
jgi:hypothetical protein